MTSLSTTGWFVVQGFHGSAAVYSETSSTRTSAQDVDAVFKFPASLEQQRKAAASTTEAVSSSSESSNSDSDSAAEAETHAEPQPKPPTPVIRASADEIKESLKALELVDNRAQQGMDLFTAGMGAVVELARGHMKAIREEAAVLFGEEEIYRDHKAAGPSVMLAWLEDVQNVVARWNNILAMPDQVMKRAVLGQVDLLKTNNFDQKARKVAHIDIKGQAAEDTLLQAERVRSATVRRVKPTSKDLASLTKTDGSYAYEMACNLHVDE